MISDDRATEPPGPGYPARETCTQFTAYTGEGGNFVAAAVCNALDSTHIMATACDNRTLVGKVAVQTKQTGSDFPELLQVSYVGI